MCIASLLLLQCLPSTTSKVFIPNRGRWRHWRLSHLCAMWLVENIQGNLRKATTSLWEEEDDVVQSMLEHICLEFYSSGQMPKYSYSSFQYLRTVIRNLYIKVHTFWSTQMWCETTLGLVCRAGGILVSRPIAIGLIRPKKKCFRLR